MKFKEARETLRNAFRKAMYGTIIAGAVGAFGTWVYGLPNSNGRKVLERIGAKVIKDKGHPPFGIGGGSGLFSSKFTIENKKGEQEDVIVSQGFFSPATVTLSR